MQQVSQLATDGEQDDYRRGYKRQSANEGHEPQPIWRSDDAVPQ
jgi:hypothetical protein